MPEQRRQEIIQTLQSMVDTFTPSKEEPILTMYGLIRRYNQAGNNQELIGGEWAKNNGITLPDF